MHMHGLFTLVLGKLEFTRSIASCSIFIRQTNKNILLSIPVPMTTQYFDYIALFGLLCKLLSRFCNAYLWRSGSDLDMKECVCAISIFVSM
jgi:hypothetical protein